MKNDNSKAIKNSEHKINCSHQNHHRQQVQLTYERVTTPCHGALRQLHTVNAQAAASDVSIARNWKQGVNERGS